MTVSESSVSDYEPNEPNKLQSMKRVLCIILSICFEMDDKELYIFLVFSPFLKL